MVMGTPEGEIMSKDRKKQRAYALNVAQQFLQRFREETNPLQSEHHFKDVLLSGVGSEARNFYGYYHTFARNFLVSNFRHEAKLARLIAAGLGDNDGSAHPKRTSLKSMFGSRLCWWHEGSGETVLIGFATISLVAAAFDLCYPKHYQGGIRPI